MKRACIALLMLLSFTLPAAAQPSLAEWTILFREILDANYMTVGGELLLVAPDGTVTTRELPSGAFFYNARLTEAVLSPNFSRLALAQVTADFGTPYPITFIDLNSPTCCTFGYFDTSTQGYDLGGFSPDGNYIAVSYVGSTGSDIVGGIGIYDAQTGNMAVSEPMDLLMGGTVGDWALMGDWAADGIEFHPNCWQCGGVYEGEWLLWNPDATAFEDITARSMRFFDLFGSSRKTIHRETLRRRYDSSFPASSEAGMLMPANVVQYIGSDISLAFVDSAPIVFQNASYRDIIFAEWVNNGQHYLVADAVNPVAVLVGRDGTQMYVSWDATRTFLNGTPNGWLELRTGASGTDIVRNVFFGGMVTNNVIASLPPYANVRVLYAPPLGVGISPSQPVAVGGFAAQVLPTSAPPQPTPFAYATSAMPVVTMPPPTVTCPNFMPSRLVVGKLGRVTPGKPNNFRDGPSINAKKIGEIPGGGVFEVVSGPVCDAANRLAWWQVRYNGVVGWTAEGQDKTYWTEPLP